MTSPGADYDEGVINQTDLRCKLIWLTGLLALLTLWWSTSAGPVIGNQPDCSRLMENLVEVANATDPLAAAFQAGVPTVDGAVRVIAELEPERALPADLPGIVEAQYLHFVQVLVEPARLCELAGHPAVRAVRSPFSATPDTPSQSPAMPYR